MKTIRTIIATLSGVLLTFAFVAWFSVRRNAAFIQRTIYQGFDQTFVVALVMGCAFLLIAIILTVAIASTESDDEEEEEELPLRPAPRPKARPAERRASASDSDMAYRRVARNMSMDRPRSQGRRAAQESGFARPKPVRQEQPGTAAQRASKPVKKAESSARKPAPKAEVPEAKQPDPAPREAMEAAEEERVILAQPAAPNPEPEAAEPLENTMTEAAAELTNIPAEAPSEAPAAPEAEAPQAEAAEAPQAADEEAPREEGTVRCVFCGSAVSRDSRFCPHCGKKL